MERLKIHAKVNADGHLKIDVPTTLRGGDVDVILLIKSKNKPRKKYDFSDLTGRLSWNGNALQTQRALRNEWE